MVNSNVGKQAECLLVAFAPLPENYIAPGWEAEIARRHSFLARCLLPLLIAVVIALFTDIETLQGGLIALDARPFLELNDSLN
jgi:hypothetical protein